MDEENPNLGTQLSARESTPPFARFEDANVTLRQISAERCYVGIDIDLAFGEAGAETEDQEFELDARKVEDLLDEHPALAQAAQAGPRPRGRFQFDRKKVFRYFGKLTKRQMQGLHALLTAAEADPKLTDLRWLAYMLATVQHECAGTWRPIEEYGKGAGRPYGKPVVVTDPQGKKHTNRYYGRGYVQLTWRANYAKMGKLLKNRLLYNPALALRPDVAYRIMSLGMRQGIFTGKKLGDYIRGSRADYVNARRIINGLDRAQTIARYATRLEKILRRSRVPVTRKPPR